MGKATRWLRGLLGMKKGKENVGDSDSGDRKEKKRWSFAKRGKIPLTDSDLMRTYLSETEKEQNKHAIAVAAATAAAADAAMAAAQAAVEVVRLTSHGRGTLFCSGRERWAAVKIQTIFRGYLSRKALRALKGLVKLQALVRGYLVRKQANATLHSMQALIRAQASVRSQRARRSFNKDHQIPPQIRHRKSVERFDEMRIDYHSKRLSGSYDPQIHPFDCSPKIVEIDTYKPRSRTRRINTYISDSGEDPVSFSSPLPCPVPKCRHLEDSEWSFGDEYKFYTGLSTPRIAYSGLLRAPTPLKSVCGGSFFRPYSNHPSYMANTQSFKAKLRSHSAPKQRPEPKRRLSLNELMAARNSLSGVRMQHSRSQVHEDLEL